MPLIQRAVPFAVVAKRLSGLVDETVRIMIMFRERLDGEFLTIPRAKVVAIVEDENAKELGDRPSGPELRLDVGESELVSLFVSQDDLVAFEDDGEILGLELGEFYVDISPWRPPAPEF